LFVGLLLATTYGINIPDCDKQNALLYGNIHEYIRCNHLHHNNSNRKLLVNMDLITKPTTLDLIKSRANTKNNNLVTKIASDFNDWLKTDQGKQAVLDCTEFQNRPEIYQGCLEDIKMTGNKELARQGALAEEEFRSKSKVSTSKKFCIASGDPHFTNYDGAYFHLQEKGIITLVKTDDLVIQEKVRKNGADKVGVPCCLTDLAIRYKNLVTIEVSAENMKKAYFNGKAVVLKQDFTYKLGGVDVRYGLQKIEWRSDAYKTHGIKFSFPNGFGLMITGGYCGVVEINVPQNYFGKVCGLCGNADGKKDKNDFSNPSGQVMDVKFGTKKWEMSGYNGPTSPLSKWEISWMPVGSDCIFMTGCPQGPNVATRSVTTQAKVDVTNPTAKVDVSKPEAKSQVTKTAAKVNVTKPAAKVDVSKPEAKSQVTKTAAKVDVSKPEAKYQVTKTVAKVNVTKPAAKVDVSKPRVVVTKPNLNSMYEHANITSMKVEMLDNLVKGLFDSLVRENNQQVIGLNKSLDQTKSTMSQFKENYLMSLKKLNDLKSKISDLNQTIQTHYKQMNLDSSYLERLEMIKPSFLASLSHANGKLFEVEKLIHDHIVKSDDKNQMVPLIKDIRNTTYYSTNDLSRQFLEHYEKYKKLFKTVSTDYSNENIKLKEFFKLYDTDVKQNYVLYKEYKRIARIVKELEQSILVSDEESELFRELASSIGRILARKPCAKPENVKFTVSDKQCATELLKSHIDNNLVY
jgi:hypothetical protein